LKRRWVLSFLLSCSIYGSGAFLFLNVQSGTAPLKGLEKPEPEQSVKIHFVQATDEKSDVQNPSDTLDEPPAIVKSKTVPAVQPQSTLKKISPPKPSKPKTMPLPPSLASKSLTIQATETSSANNTPSTSHEVWESRPRWTSTPTLYPRRSQDEGIEGTVILHLNMSTQGHVLETKLKKSSGFLTLDNAALKSARKWKVQPKLVKGQAVSFWAEVEVPFILKK
jgi:periplasmic protein TonB